MKNCAALLGAFALAVASPAFAQRPESRGESRPEAHGQREPNAPGANQVSATAAETRATHPPESERRSNGHVNSVPHVNNDKWYGHDKPNDKRYHLAHPFEHGRFADIGPGHRFRVERFDRDHHRFWFPGGFYFEIASWDWDAAADWCWDCGDDFVVYDDPDHDSWYLIYNVHIGLYIHAQYMGS